MNNTTENQTDRRIWVWWHLEGNLSLSHSKIKLRNQVYSTIKRGQKQSKCTKQGLNGVNKLAKGMKLRSTECMDLQGDPLRNIFSNATNG